VHPVAGTVKVVANTLRAKYFNARQNAKRALAGGAQLTLSSVSVALAHLHEIIFFFSTLY
tara:strand:+ start:826 stop:1005 length:180 start_codon:yes stop_codon:yes gene_type:complete